MVKILFAKVSKENAEAVKRKLVNLSIFDKSIQPFSKGMSVFFPVTKKVSIENVVFSFHEVKKPSAPSQEAGISFDVIGDIAIIEKPREKRMPVSRIAKSILNLHKNVKTVALKEGALAGPFRLRKLKIIAGEKKTETIHRENGCSFKVDVTKAYFSPRLSHERKRIASLVKPGETVFVPFAGVGPFAVVIAKQHPDVQIFANELNPEAVKFLNDNIRLNKVHNIKVIPGDARDLLTKYKETADRVVVPLPMMSGQFLDVAFGLAKNGGIVHFYHFTESFEKTMSLIEDYAKEKKKKIRLVGSRIVRAYAPGIIEVVIDFQLL